MNQELIAVRLSHSALIHNILPQKFYHAVSPALRTVVIMLLGSLLLALSAHIQVPFWPVPMTLQLLVVLALGLICGRWLGAGIILTYLIEGALGLPVFARGGGFSYFLGPTAGYLWGFLAAAWFVGMFADRGWSRHITKSMLACLLGVVIVYIFGAAWLLILGNGLQDVIKVGIIPFLMVDAIKAALVALAIPQLWRLLNISRPDQTNL